MNAGTRFRRGADAIREAAGGGFPPGPPLGQPARVRARVCGLARLEAVPGRRGQEAADQGLAEQGDGRLGADRRVVGEATRCRHRTRDRAAIWRLRRGHRSLARGRGQLAGAGDAARRCDDDGRPHRRRRLAPVFSDAALRAGQHRRAARSWHRHARRRWVRRAAAEPAPVGGAYEWARWRRPEALPRWIVDAVRAPKPGAEREEITLIERGARNDTLARYAGAVAGPATSYRAANSKHFMHAGTPARSRLRRAPARLRAKRRDWPRIQRLPTRRSRRAFVVAPWGPQKTLRCCFAGSHGPAGNPPGWAWTSARRRSWRACMLGFCVWLVSTRASLFACSHPRSRFATRGDAGGTLARAGLPRLGALRLAALELVAGDAGV
jgi:hypothetical protein